MMIHSTNSLKYNKYILTTQTVQFKIYKVLCEQCLQFVVCSYLFKSAWDIQLSRGGHYLTNLWTYTVKSVLRSHLWDTEKVAL